MEEEEEIAVDVAEAAAGEGVMAEAELLVGDSEGAPRHLGVLAVAVLRQWECWPAHLAVISWRLQRGFCGAALTVGSCSPFLLMREWEED